MDSALKILLPLILLGSVHASIDYEYGHCERLVKTWATSSSEENSAKDKHTLQDLLFFLHIPRTGGRTYFHCFLRKLYDGSEECPRSYDKLHFDPSKSKCRLLSTHDDYSLMSKLPRERTSVVTILRNPIDRVFSTYEFSIEVAARFLIHPNLTSATQMAKCVRSKGNVTSTLDIWPWKYLVPWMRKDLFDRRDARKLRGIDHIESSDPYNVEDIVMPLQKYLENPIAHEVIHNGATFQIAGLTNNSHLAESHEIRRCVQKYEILGKHVLQVAKKRMDSMLYVGLTEDHRESASLFADVVGAQVISQTAQSETALETEESKTKQPVSVSESRLDAKNQDETTSHNTSETTSTENTEAKSEKMTLKKLMGVYETCISDLRKTQATRRVKSLKRISPANFTKKARLKVPEQVIEQIRLLNSLDLELYEYAKGIFAKEHQHVSEKLNSAGGFAVFFKASDGIKLWNLLLLVVMPILLLFVFFVFVKARRRMSKVKI